LTGSENTRIATNQSERSVSYRSHELETLVGHHDQNLKLIEDQLGVRIVPRDDQLQIFGDEQAAQDTEDLL